MGKLIFIYFLSLQCFASVDIAWESLSDPRIMGIHYEKNPNHLPKTGVVESSEKFWSGDYWADYYGGINKRWFGRNKNSAPDFEAAKKMNIEELASLSPSEKWDLYKGKYNYPFKNFVQNSLSKNPKMWEGICHGWAPATINHREPTPKYLINPHGIQIPFGSSDIKALLSWYYAHTDNGHTYQMGSRCYGDRNNNDCIEDMNAGAFHIVLTNEVGIDGKSFILDLERFDQVWNHPVYSYSFEELRSLPPETDSAPGTKSMVWVRTKLILLNESKNFWQTILRSEEQKYMSRVYEYTLDLDSKNRIIGGKWQSKDRPDFIWKKEMAQDYVGHLEGLYVLLDD